MPAILDAYALIALATDEPAAAQVEDALREGSARMSAINVAETVDQLVRVRGHEFATVEALIRDVLSESIEAVAVDIDSSLHAADLRRRHYRRRGSALSLSDCLALSLTLTTEDGRLATADPPLLEAAQAEGAATIALPGSG